MHLFDELVRLEPVEHRYFHIHTGEEFTSVGKVLGSLSEKFEDKPAYHRATEEKKAEWKVNNKIATDHGTRIHEALERYAKSAIILPEDEDLREMIISVMSEYKGYYRVYDELCIYNLDLKIAGTTDKLMVLKNSKKSEFDIEDYKTNLNNGIVNFSKYDDRLFPPFDYLPDCNFVKYSLQLSTYAYMVEKLTGRRVRRLGIRYIPPDNFMNHVYIPVMYLKPEVEEIFRRHSQKQLNIA